MSRRLTQHVRWLAQRGATKDTVTALAAGIYRGKKKRDVKVARLVSRYLNGRKRAA